jgi:predicted ester cyclase
MTAATVDSVVRRYLCECVEGFSSASLDELVSPELVVTIGEMTVAGREAYARILADYHDAFSEITLRVFDVLRHGSLVALRFRESGRHVKTYHGIACTGQRYEKVGMNLYEVRDDQIARMWVHEDIVGWLNQIRRAGVT